MSNKAQSILANASQKRTFGQLYEIDEDGYQDILEDLASETYTVVHIGDAQLVACRRLNAKMRLLAERHTRVRFCHTSLAAIGADFDRDALPIVLVYRNGDVEQTFFKVTNQLGSTSFDEYDVARLLAASGVLKLEDVEE